MKRGRGFVSFTFPPRGLLFAGQFLKNKRMKELLEIQQKLKAPKGQYNHFGKYRYRSAEDILEAVKPLLREVNCTLTISDDIMQVGERIYVKATTTLRNEAGEVETTTAFAREEETKKGMDGSQITGAASSYARKYALNGLFCIDDTKDADADENGGEDMNLQAAIQEISGAQSVNELTFIYNKYTMLHTDAVFMNNLSTKKKQLK